MRKNDDQNLLAEFLPDRHAIEATNPPPGRRFTLYALLTLVISVTIWAGFSEIDKLVIAPGRLVTPLPNLVVQPLESGILKSIEVRIGQVVKKGDVLARLDPTFTHADLTQLKSRRDILSMQAKRLALELSSEPSVIPKFDSAQWQLQNDLLKARKAAYAARIRQFDESIQHLYALLETNKQDQEALAKRVQSLKELENMYAELENQKLSARSQVLEVKNKYLEVKRDYLLAVNQEKEIKSKIDMVEAERAAFEKKRHQDVLEQLSTILEQRNEVNEQINKARLRSELITLVAQQDSVVLEIGNKSVGSVVQPAEKLFVLVPLEAAIVAEVEVDTADIGDIRVGDTARIKIDAYPFQKYGAAKGHIISISADAFSRKSVMGGDSYYYLVRISLDDTKLDHMQRPARLLPGMTLTAEIVTGKRSVISYFLYPVLRVFDESLRER